MDDVVMAGLQGYFTGAGRKIRTSGPSLAKLALLLILAAPASSSGRELEFAPIVEIERGDALSYWRALGPFFEHKAVHHGQETQYVTALLRPLVSFFDASEEDRRGLDLLWPVGVRRVRNREMTQRFLLYVGSNGDVRDPESDKRHWLLPLLFVGQSEEQGSYAAVFPVAGNIHDIAGIDAVRFAAFPLYLATEDVDVSSKTVLWPIFSMTQGPQLRKWRVFPLCGAAHRPESVRRFYLWPFVHTIDFRGENDGSGGVFVLPFGGYLARGEASRWSVLWPFFQGAESQVLSQLHCPWPFYQRKIRMRDGTKASDLLYIWPVWGRKERPESQYRFAAWPFYHQFRSSDADARTSRTVTWLLPFYASRVERRQGESTRVLKQVWPLLRYVRNDSGWTRLETLALWPRWGDKPIERNYAPLWQVYTFTESPASRRHDLLWGLVQYESRQQSEWELILSPLVKVQRSADGAGVSLLKGLYGYDPGRSKAHRLLWFLNW